MKPEWLGPMWLSRRLTSGAPGTQTHRAVMSLSVEKPRLHIFRGREYLFSPQRGRYFLGETHKIIYKTESLKIGIATKLKQAYWDTLWENNAAKTFLGREYLRYLPESNFYEEQGKHLWRPVIKDNNFQIKMGQFHSIISHPSYGNQKLQLDKLCQPVKTDNTKRWWRCRMTWRLAWSCGSVEIYNGFTQLSGSLVQNSRKAVTEAWLVCVRRRQNQGLWAGEWPRCPSLPCGKWLNPWRNTCKHAELWVLLTGMPSGRRETPRTSWGSSHVTVVAGGCRRVLCLSQRGRGFYEGPPGRFWSQEIEGLTWSEVAEGI